MRKPMPQDDAFARSLRAALDRPHADDAHPDEGRIAAYVAHELDEAATERLEAHLATCERCAA
ncbi:zf-HC2 domain-containing protein, partial [Candidatus Binatia bacterium]|nr:zf-HC2 domain-containing protein [Candidatus Binatia bacterium]